jgi:hypothetical protein
MLQATAAHFILVKISGNEIKAKTTQSFDRE